jgi:hypothetical protein
MTYSLSELTGGGGTNLSATYRGPFFNGTDNDIGDRITVTVHFAEIVFRYLDLMDVTESVLIDPSRITVVSSISQAGVAPGSAR